MIPFILGVIVGAAGLAAGYLFLVFRPRVWRDEDEPWFV